MARETGSRPLVPRTFTGNGRDSGEPPEPLLKTNQRHSGWLVVGLIVIAVVVALIMISLAQRSERGSAREETSPPSGSSGPAVVTTAPAPTAPPRSVPAGEMAIVSSAEFDPQPGDGREHPEQLGFLTDGRDDTMWTTSCYRQRSMAPKQGVGVVLRLSAPARGHRLVLTSPSEGWAASVFVASEVGTRLRDWGPPVSTSDDLGPGEVELELGDADGRFVLIWLTDLGEPACKALPYQVRIGEVRLVQG
jgi:hypothetical protein